MHGHGADRVLGHRTHVRDNHDADHNTGREHVEAGQLGQELLQQRRDKQQREVTVHHGWHGAQQFHERFYYLARSVTGVLAEINGRDGAERDGDHECDGGGNEGAGHERQDAVVGVVEQRCPLCVGEKIQQGDLFEKAGGFDQQHTDNADGDHHGRERRQEQQTFDQTFAQVAQARTGGVGGKAGGQDSLRDVVMMKCSRNPNSGI